MRRIFVLCLLFQASFVQAQTSPVPGVDVQSVMVSQGSYSIRASNRWWGPIQVQVQLTADSQNVKPSLFLPQKWEVAPRLQRELFQVTTKDPSQGGRFGLSVKAVPGSPVARHQADFPYQWPIAQGAGRMDQGFGGRHSHSDPENYYAIDIAALPNTPVIAARSGIVMATESRFTRGGSDPSLRTQANYVRILQDDGTMAVYVHLAANSVRVSPGQAIQAGHVLGGVGATGYASGPHLHFAIQINAGMDLRSVPFKMHQPKGVSTGMSRPSRN